ncbi:MAG: aromatic ring-hydroxylating dioxygenase subunit alpha [Pseudomonadota bacterium]
MPDGDKPTDLLSDALDQVMQPVGRARGLPNALYVDPATEARERQKVFFEGWSCIGFAKDVPKPGDALPIDHLGAPLLMLRDRDGQLRVFENVCRHRGMILVEEARNFPGVIRCPYHSWCYSLDGRLRATPHVGGPGVNRHASVVQDATGLNALRSGVFLDAVFVTFSDSAPAFNDWIAPLAEHWDDYAGRALFHGGAASSFTLEVAANWKLAVENYCESYHLPWVHPALNSYSRLEDHYHIETPRRFSGQGTVVYNPNLDATVGGAAFPDFPGLPGRWDSAAEYVALYPNVLFGVHRDHVFAIRLEPLGQGRTREHVELYYTAPEAAEGAAFAAMRAANADLWRQVFEEDIFVVEGMQRGRYAPNFDGGRFSAVMDSPTHCFHDWVADRLVN